MPPRMKAEEFLDRVRPALTLEDVEKKTYELSLHNRTLVALNIVSHLWLIAFVPGEGGALEFSVGIRLPAQTAVFVRLLPRLSFDLCFSHLHLILLQKFQIMLEPAPKEKERDYIASLLDILTKSVPP